MLRVAGAVCLAPHFENTSPDYPIFSVLITSQNREQAEKDKLAAIKEKLTAQEKQQIIDQATSLEARQNEQDDPGVLPKVGLEDVPDEMSIPQGQSKEVGKAHASIYEQGTNGLIYQQIIIELPELDDELIDALPFYTSCLTELGCGDKNYLQTQEWQSSVSGGISAYTTVRGEINDVQKTHGYFVLTAKALSRNHQQLNDLMKQTLEDARFDEHERIRELIAQKRARREQSVTGSGHSLAMTAASSGMSPAAAFSHRLSGLVGIQYIKQLDDSLAQEESISKLAKKFESIHEKILKAPRQYLAVTEEDAKEVLCNFSYSPHEWVGGYRAGANHKQTNFLVVDYDDGLTIVGHIEL